MIRNILVLTSLIALIAGYTWYGDFNTAPTKNVQKIPVAQIAHKAPDFIFTDMKGKKHSLSDFENKTIILNFWASWCAPCVVEFPQMLELAERTKDKTVFIFLSVDENTDDMARFLKKIERRINSQNVFIGQDKNKAISQDLYQTYKLPETYLMSPGLLIKEKVIGLKSPWNDPDMIEKVNAL